MDFLNSIVNIITSFIREPAIFIGIIAFIGLVTQKKGISDIIKGTLKTIVGTTILFVGINVISESIFPLSEIFNKIFSLEGGTPADYGVFLERYGAQVGAVMLIGFISNIIIARLTPFKTIYLTGNLLYWYPMLYLAVGIESGLKGTTLFVFATILHIATFTISPWIIKKHMKYVTGNEDFTIGHTATPFCLLGSEIGKLVNQPEKSMEDIKLPKGFDFFKDTTITSGIVIFIVYVIVGLMAGNEIRTEVLKIDVSHNLFVFSLLKGASFAAGMVVLLQGSRMMLGEIVPAFKGISDILVPNSIPALDIPMIFTYSPTSLTIGFVLSMFSSIITIFILGSLGILKYAVVPLTIACYFDVAPGAIFANKRGGYKAVVLTSLLGGVILMTLAAFTIPIVGGTVGSFIQAFGGNEFSIGVLIADIIAKIIN